MGCISATVQRIGENLKVTTHREGLPLSLSVQRIGENLKVTTGLVCSAAGLNKLQVSPEIVWLTPSNGYSDSFIVTSNVEWVIIKE